eukprot:scaffold604_cov59-Phaeocystis_antarctica.AAC.1
MIELSTIESAPPARAMSAHAAMSVTCMRLSKASTCEYQAQPRGLLAWGSSPAWRRTGWWGSRSTRGSCWAAWRA